ncbi:MAG: right-handed parallel beta-helix repeat-containing protein [Planctomycetota bacterium]
MRVARIAFLMLSASACALAPIHAQTTRRVPLPFATIQAAIDAAQPGDEVVVDPGTYRERIDFRGKAITVRSSAGPSATIIDGDGMGIVVTFENGEGRASVLRGFTVTNGVGDDGANVYCLRTSPTIVGNHLIHGTAKRGGGIYTEAGAPRVEGNEIRDNRADYGGGVSVQGGRVTLIGNRIVDNSSRSGGGVLCEDATLRLLDNRIEDNSWYGVLALRSDLPLVRGNVVRGNRSDAGGAGLVCSGGAKLVLEGNRFEANEGPRGGGVAVEDVGEVEVLGCVFIANRAKYQWGAGLYVEAERLLVRDCVFRRNRAFLYGGGLFCQAPRTRVINSVFWRNSGPRGGGAVHVRAADVIHCTLVDNSGGCEGGGVRSTGALRVTNTVLWDNFATQAPQAAVDGPLEMTHSNVDGGQVGVQWAGGGPLLWGPGMLSEAPRFVESAAGDLRLQFDSPCRDAGSATAVTLPGVDFEGDPRIAQDAPDIGADEFYPHLYTQSAPSPGVTYDLRVIAPPGDPVVWALSAVPQLARSPVRVQGLRGRLALQEPFAAVALGVAPAAGWVALRGSLPAAFPVPLDVPTQSVVGLRLTNPEVLEVR